MASLRFLRGNTDRPQAQGGDLLQADSADRLETVVSWLRGESWTTAAFSFLCLLAHYDGMEEMFVNHVSDKRLVLRICKEQPPLNNKETIKTKEDSNKLLFRGYAGAAK